MDVFIYIWRRTFVCTHFEPAKHNNVHIYTYQYINSSIHMYRCISIYIWRDKDVYTHLENAMHNNAVAEQCVAMGCSVLQCVAACCSVL